MADRVDLPRTDRASRLIAAPAGRLFACWADPALLARWLPPRGMTGRVDLLDLRVGRPFRIVLSHDDPGQAGKSGGGSDIVAGRFVAVDPPRHLAFVSRFASDDPQLQGEMRMDWHFDPAAQCTLVRIVARDVPPGVAPEDHLAGMASSLSQLAALVE
jgi:uncharacterized protein YndB with AHSA1/START domain